MDKYWIVTITHKGLGISLPYHFTEEPLALLFTSRVRKMLGNRAIVLIASDVFYSTEESTLALVDELKDMTS